MKKILLVIEREFITRVKKKSFIILTLLVPLLFAGLMLVPTFILQIKSDDDKTIAVLDHSGLIAKDLINVGTIKFVNETASVDLLKNSLTEGNNYALLYIEKGDGNTIGDITIYSENAIGMDILNIVTSQIRSLAVQLNFKKYDIPAEQIAQILYPHLHIKTIRLDEQGVEKESNTIVLTGLSIICGILILLIITIFGVQIMRGVIEEKSSRIVEIIISSIRPVELMLGKIIGVALVVLTQIVIWIIFFGAILLIAQSQFPDIIHQIQSYTQDVAVVKMIICFVLYLIFGYLLYASMYAIVGSAADNEMDTQQLQLIITLPLIIGCLIMNNVVIQPDSPLAFWSSMIPFISPMVMLTRIPFGVPVWEIILSLTLLIATFILFTWIAARIYRVGILMYGKKATLKELIKWLKYKQ
ncbi:MAG: ABC transporter permease [Prevotellaceae bacterium]|jgi:ABC-2 type transport system permease protein|nr:ABC transporter permease [Prevotellaceae bacterium]